MSGRRGEHPAVKYLKAAWKHAFEREPVLLYSGIDEARREIRKVETRRDGRSDRAGSRGAREARG